MGKSSQHKLPRKPRVHITYDVEIGGATVKRELPFVVGVVGDFSGNPTGPLKKLSERDFVKVDRDNFNEVMAKMKPGLSFRVKNTLKDDGSELPVQLKFNTMEDFEPASIIQQVEPLRKLFEDRQRLNNLLAKAEVSEDIENVLEKILSDAELLKKLASEVGGGEAAAPAESTEGGESSEGGGEGESTEG
jgi:type VI secretion system protein ImpB